MSGWAALAGRRIGVWGVGVEGLTTLRRLQADGLDPAAVVDQVAGMTDTGLDIVAFDGGGLELLAGCDLVIKSPGISPYDEAALAVVASGAQLTGGLALWLEDAPRDRVACITGTKGKSTTTAIAGALSRGLGQQTFVGGNLGSAPWDPELPEADWYLIETSSYQAHDITVGPRVVAVTSLSQDHLTWHHGYKTYVGDKLSLCTRPGVEIVVAPVADPELARFRDLLGEHVSPVDDDSPAWVNELHLFGKHNARNALVAQRVLVSLGVPGAAEGEALAAAAATYQPLPSRLANVGTVCGVDFVDDSLSTNTLPTLAAVDAFDGRRVALLVGGHDRGIDYAPLAQGLLGRDAPVYILTLPDNGRRISAALRAHAPGLLVNDFDDLTSAVEAAYRWAKPNGVVLLSPAAPSFGVFKNYTERADVFTAAMRRLQ